MSEHKGQNYMTLQLTANALDKLFESEGPDFALKLKQAAMEEFARRRVKALSNEHFEQMTTGVLRQLIKDEIGTFQDHGWGPGKTTIVNFKEPFRTAVEFSVKSEVTKMKAELMALVLEVAQKELAKFLESYQEEIRKIVDDSIGSDVGNKVKRLVTHRLQKAVTAALANTDTNELLKEI